MEREYKVLFSIQLRHEAYGLNTVVPELSLVPTSQCIGQLRRFAMLYKPNPAGGFVAIEKLKTGSATYTPTRPIRELTGFTFFVRLTDPSLLNNTDPYKDPNVHFESGFSDSFILYGDNLDASLTLDASTELTETAISSSLQDIFFITSGQLTLPAPALSSLVRVEALLPGETVKEYSPESGKKFIRLDLEEGAYRLTRVNAGTPVNERVLVGSGLPPPGTIAILRIYKDGTVDYDQAVRYTFTLKKHI